MLHNRNTRLHIAFAQPARQREASHPSLSALVSSLRTPSLEEGDPDPMIANTSLATKAGATVGAMAAFLTLATPMLAQTAGTATVTPESFSRGEQITVSYDATGGPLEGASQVFIHRGFNGFSGVQVPNPAMTSAGPNLWTHSVTIPNNASEINIAFNNGAGLWDNNDTADWSFAIDLSSYPLGATVLPPAEGGGVVFRVWAPNATSANVRGQFNGFGLGDPMTLEPTTGEWSAFVANAVNGQRYKYFLNGSDWRRDPRARRHVNSVGDSIIYNTDLFNWGPTDFTLDETRNLVIYQMHIGSWGGPATATFASAMARLDYLVDLGVNVVELLPVNEFPGSQSGGYNLIDPWSIESSYGTPDEFKAFIRACHERGLGVFVDVVHNHYGPSDLDLWGFDTGGNNAGIYFYSSPPELAESGFGPRPDYSRPEVRDYILDNTRMWIEEYRVDGFRWDFTKGIRATLDGNFDPTGSIPEGALLLRQANDIIKSYPGVFSIAEDFLNDPNLTAPTPGGLGFDSEWRSDFHFSVVPQLTAVNDADRNIFAVANQIPGNFRRVHYLESHDEVWDLNDKDRVAWRIDNANPASYRARKLGTAGTAIMLTSHGIPMIFQGHEWGEGDRWDDGVGMNWSRITTAPYSGTLAMTRDLIHLRRNLRGTTNGLSGDGTNVFLALDNIDVVAWHRFTGGSAPGDDVVIVANLSSVSYGEFEIGFPRSGMWYEHFNSDSTTYGADYSDVGVGQTVTTSGPGLHGFSQRGTIAIGPYSVVILSQAPPIETGLSDWMIIY